MAYIKERGNNNYFVRVSYGRLDSGRPFQKSRLYRPSKVNLPESKVRKELDAFVKALEEECRIEFQSKHRQKATEDAVEEEMMRDGFQEEIKAEPRPVLTPVSTSGTPLFADLLGEKWHEEGFLFTDWCGHVMHPHTPTKQFDKFLKKYGFRHLKFHGLRHSSATYLLSNGCDIKTVSKRLGHTSIDTTNIYVSSFYDNKICLIVFVARRPRYCGITHGHIADGCQRNNLIGLSPTAGYSGIRAFGYGSIIIPNTCHGRLLSAAHESKS